MVRGLLLEVEWGFFGPFETASGPKFGRPAKKPLTGLGWSVLDCTNRCAFGRFA